MADEHAHGQAPSHTHEGATPGHTHDVPPPAAAGPPPAVDIGPSPGGLVVRLLLSALGAAGMIVGAFLPWAFDDAGTSVEPVVFYSTDVQAQASLLTSAGGIVILLGLLALVGMALRTGWLTSLMGALGIVAAVLVLITLYRLPVEVGIADVQVGLWLILAGGVLALIGGFFGARPRTAAGY